MSFTDNNFYCDNARYERSKIGKLRNEREEIQEKTYKNWINSILIQARTGITDIYTDFQSGEKLIILLELLTGEKVGPINRSSSILHKIANVTQCMKFIESKNVYLESIGPNDIVNGNKKLTLGLIWTLILRFQLSKHLDFAQYDLKLIKESLLLWCQNKIKHLRFIEIVDFHKSWQNGWAFIGLVHSFRPESIDIDALKKKENRELLAIAFDTAYQQLLIPKILDVDDVINSPDENSILTYVSYFYNLHSKEKMSETSVKRVKCLMNNLSDLENMQDNYLNLCSSLLKWIKEKCLLFEQDIDVKRAQEELFDFKNYFFNERFEKLKSRNECESLYFEIISMQKETKIKPFKPPNGLKVKDLEKSWNDLELIETKRQNKLESLINQQEKLSKLSQIFDLKSRKFEDYIDSKLALLNKIFLLDNRNLSREDLETHLRQSESICRDILASNDKFDSFKKLADELIEQKHVNAQFYEQYKSHIDEKLKHLNDMASSNLDIIILTNQLFINLADVENLLIELNNLNKNLESIVIILEANSIDPIENIVANLEKLKYLEMQLDVLEKDYLEYREKFHQIESDLKYQPCFVLFDIEAFGQKMDEAVDNIDNCREKIESYKKIIDYQIELNNFYSDIEFVHQFLNEKRIITKSNPDDCLNLSSIHFIQRRNNMIKLEMKVMEKDLCSTSKKGYQLMNDDYPEISDTIFTMIENIKIEFQNFIVVINERTLLINDCIVLLNLIYELNQHQALLEKINENNNENFYQNLKETLNLYEDEMITLNEIYDKLSKLSIHLTEYYLDDTNSKSYILYLNEYPLDQIDLMDSHVYLICEIDQLPDIRPEHFWIIHLNLFGFIKSKKNHLKQLLLMTEYDFDVEKLKQVLDFNADDNRKIIDADQSSKIDITDDDDKISMDEIELIFEIFLDKQNSKELEYFLKERNPEMDSDFANIDELILIIENTTKLLQSVRKIIHLCENNDFIEEMNCNQSEIVPTESIECSENEPSLENNLQDLSNEIVINLEQPNNKEIEFINKTEMTTESIEEPDPIESEIRKKKKIFSHKLKKDIIYIYQYFCDIDNNDDLKFKLKFLGKIIDDNVKRIDIYIIENPNDTNNENIKNISKKLIDCNEKLLYYQKLSTFKDLLDDFNLNIVNSIDNLYCLQPQNSIESVKSDLQENNLRNDIRTIESIEDLYVYYFELFTEFENENDLDDNMKEYMKEIILIFEKYKKTIKLTKIFLKKKWDTIQEIKKQKRLNSLIKLHNDQQKKPCQTLLSLLPKEKESGELSVLVKKDVDEENKNKLLENRNDQNDVDDDDHCIIENLFKELELVLFDIECEKNDVHKFKIKQVEKIFLDIANSTDNAETLTKLESFKKRLDRILLRKIHDRNSEDFQTASEHFLQCCQDDISEIDTCLKNIDHLPLNPQAKIQLREKLAELRRNHIHLQTLFVLIRKDNSDSNQIEIRSKLVLLQDTLLKLKNKIEQLNTFLDIDDVFDEASKNIEYIFITIELIDNDDENEDDSINDKLKELQTKTNATKNLIELIDSTPTIDSIESLKNKERNNLEISNNKAKIIIEYKILKYQTKSKFQRLKDCRSAKEDEEFQEIIIEIQEHEDLLENVFKKLDLNNSDDQKLLSNVLNNWSVLMKKLETFNYLLIVDENRKELEEIQYIVIETPVPKKKYQPIKKILKSLKSERPKETMEKSIENDSDQDDEKLILNDNLSSIDLDSTFEDNSLISTDDLINNNVYPDNDFMSVKEIDEYSSPSTPASKELKMNSLDNFDEENINKSSTPITLDESHDYNDDDNPSDVNKTPNNIPSNGISFSDSEKSFKNNNSISNIDEQVPNLQKKIEQLEPNTNPDKTDAKHHTLINLKVIDDDFETPIEYVQINQSKKSEKNKKKKSKNKKKKNADQNVIDFVGVDDHIKVLESSKEANSYLLDSNVPNENDERNEFQNIVPENKQQQEQERKHINQDGLSPTKFNADTTNSISQPNNEKDSLVDKPNKSNNQTNDSNNQVDSLDWMDYLTTQPTEHKKDDKEKDTKRMSDVSAPIIKLTGKEEEKIPSKDLVSDDLLDSMLKSEDNKTHDNHQDNKIKDSKAKSKKKSQKKDKHSSTSKEEKTAKLKVEGIEDSPDVVSKNVKNLISSDTYPSKTSENLKHEIVEKSKDPEIADPKSIEIQESTDKKDNDPNINVAHSISKIIGKDGTTETQDSNQVPLDWMDYLSFDSSKKDQQNDSEESIPKPEEKRDFIENPTKTDDSIGTTSIIDLNIREKEIPSQDLESDIELNSATITKDDIPQDPDKKVKDLKINSKKKSKSKKKNKSSHLIDEKPKNEKDEEIPKELKDENVTTKTELKPKQVYEDSLDKLPNQAERFKNIVSSDTSPSETFENLKHGIVGESEDSEIISENIDIQESTNKKENDPNVTDTNSISETIGKDEKTETQDSNQISLDWMDYLTPHSNDEKIQEEEEANKTSNINPIGEKGEEKTISMDVSSIETFDKKDNTDPNIGVRDSVSKINETEEILDETTQSPIQDSNKVSLDWMDYLSPDSDKKNEHNDSEESIPKLDEKDNLIQKPTMTDKPEPKQSMKEILREFKHENVTTKTELKPKKQVYEDLLPNQVEQLDFTLHSNLGKDQEVNKTSNIKEKTIPTDMSSIKTTDHYQFDSIQYKDSVTTTEDQKKKISPKDTTIVELANVEDSDSNNIKDTTNMPTISKPNEEIKSTMFPKDVLEENEPQLPSNSLIDSIVNDNSFDEPYENEDHSSKLDDLENRVDFIEEKIQNITSEVSDLLKTTVEQEEQQSNLILTDENDLKQQPKQSENLKPEQIVSNFDDKSDVSKIIEYHIKIEEPSKSDVSEKEPQIEESNKIKPFKHEKDHPEIIEIASDQSINQSNKLSISRPTQEVKKNKSKKSKSQKWSPLSFDTTDDSGHRQTTNKVEDYLPDAKESKTTKKKTLQKTHGIKSDQKNLLPTKTDSFPGNTSKIIKDNQQHEEKLLENKIDLPIIEVASKEKDNLTGEITSVLGNKIEQLKNNDKLAISSSTGSLESKSLADTKETPRKMLKARRTQPKPIIENQNKIDEAIAMLSVANNDSYPVMETPKDLHSTIDPKIKTESSSKTELNKFVDQSELVKLSEDNITKSVNLSIDAESKVDNKLSVINPKNNDTDSIIETTTAINNGKSIKTKKNVSQSMASSSDEALVGKSLNENHQSSNDEKKVNNKRNGSKMFENDLPHSEKSEEPTNTVTKNIKEPSTWWYYLTPLPMSSQKTDSDSDFASIINWNEIENVHCVPGSQQSTSKIQWKNNQNNDTDKISEVDSNQTNVMNNDNSNLKNNSNGEISPSINVNTESKPSKKRIIKKKKILIKPPKQDNSSGSHFNKKQFNEIPSKPLKQQQHQQPQKHQSQLPIREINTTADNLWLKRLRRLLHYSLPFYLLFLLLLLIFIIIPKDEDEFNCLRRISEYEYQLKRIYLDGPPPI